MHLTREEEDILRGEHGEGMRKAIEILVAIGKIYGADRLVPISSAHISGVSYYNIREGLEFLRDFSGEAKVSVKTTLNPGGMDLCVWRNMGIDEKFAEKQKGVIEVYKGMGIEPTLTCTPYLVGNRPAKGDHVAWSESSAVTYVNSVLGAMTNRESGISALAAAIIGKTPLYGMHLKEERAPKVIIKLNAVIHGPSDLSALGYVIAKKIGHEIPLIAGIENVSDEGLKLLSASIATYAGLPIFHIKGVTAEWMEFDTPGEVVEVDDGDLMDAYEYLRDQFDEVDIVWIGCPHVGIDELKKIASLLRNKSVNSELWITTSRRVRDEAERLGYIAAIEEAGAKVICDTCVAVAPLKGMFRTLVTNSAKACYYCRGVNRFLVRVASLDKCIDVALKGGWE